MLTEIKISANDEARDPRFPLGAAIFGIPVLILVGWMTINLAETLIWRLALMWME